LELLDSDSAFDVIFSDVVMPEMSGVEFARILRRRFPNLPVVLTSGYSHILVEESRGEFPLLQKPYSAESVARALHDAREAKASFACRSHCGRPFNRSITGSGNGAEFPLSSHSRHSAKSAFDPLRTFKAGSGSGGSSNCLAVPKIGDGRETGPSRPRSYLSN
jgi:DNA-binding LytR/AlgR family response regulator